jgi:hypothetical protein
MFENKVRGNNQQPSIERNFIEGSETRDEPKYILYMAIKFS